jgi:hypothetical protein
MIYFETSSFKSFNISTPDFLECFLPELKIKCHVLIHRIMIYFGVRASKFQYLHSRFHPECFLPELQIKHRVSLQIGWSLFTSGLRGFPSHFPSGVLSPRVVDHATHILLHRRSIFTSGIWASGVLSPPLSLSSRAFSPEVHRSLSRVHPNITGGSLLRTLGFGSFIFLAPVFIQSVFSWS